MLKRQRAISPPPSNPSVPLVTDEPESFHRDSKRRRVLPPSLDGPSRNSILRTEEDDGEEDDDDGSMNHPYPSGVAAFQSQSTSRNTEYESANTFLHDLHALHRHRLIFSSPLPQYPPIEQTPAPHRDKSQLPPTLEYSSMSFDKQDLSGFRDRGLGVPVKEAESVKERYEDTNRLLGSLFLTRRKQLEPESSPYDT
ncbi:hypothetical protein R3P38DRAFT_2824372 [Favolaschia claudopus]|uniref:Uncharacterized protein n=1 Tax=Favolaschia claudopus TaxID=2862362 RepID=A0AAW0EG72_9AGAR